MTQDEIERNIRNFVANTMPEMVVNCDMVDIVDAQHCMACNLALSVFTTALSIMGPSTIQKIMAINATLVHSLIEHMIETFINNGAPEKEIRALVKEKFNFEKMTELFDSQLVSEEP